MHLLVLQRCKGTSLEPCPHRHTLPAACVCPCTPHRADMPVTAHTCAASACSTRLGLLHLAGNGAALNRQGCSPEQAHLRIHASEDPGPDAGPAPVLAQEHAGLPHPGAAVVQERAHGQGQQGHQGLQSPVRPCVGRLVPACNAKSGLAVLSRPALVQECALSLSKQGHQGLQSPVWPCVGRLFPACRRAGEGWSVQVITPCGNDDMP